MFSKVELYNISLSALLLERQLIDTTTENSNEKKVLDQFYNIALFSTLEDLDLDSTHTKVTLELVTDEPAAPYDLLWDYIYKYPSNCILFRGIFSGFYKDNRQTHVPKAVEMYDGAKAILTKEVNAVGKYIPKDIPLDSLTPMTGMAIAYRLAALSAPLIVGKGALKLKDSIELKYTEYKAQAQEQDVLENYNYHDEHVESEFVAARMT